jgi:hypothetical protein
MNGVSATRQVNPQVARAQPKVSDELPGPKFQHENCGPVLLVYHGCKI